MITPPEIRGYDLNGAPILHAIQTEPDRWHGVDFERCRGICRYNREQLITRVADLIGGGHLYRLETGAERLDIDRAGNVWRDHLYQPPDQYLPAVIKP